ncbi:uncharacterized protein LOC116998849 [Catharus ustulatus]|uniref:uncharacterized protein LOC116998849 n=1 Tax=Catharus ustulatus TaxID=91951 RepID=UPI00140B385A|nr:uncharacterized protein LOC116998849 [Catharus ustulatus]
MSLLLRDVSLEESPFTWLPHSNPSTLMCVYPSQILLLLKPPGVGLHGPGGSFPIWDAPRLHNLLCSSLWNKYAQATMVNGGNEQAVEHIFPPGCFSNVGNVFRVGIWTWTSCHPWACNHQAMGLIQSYSFDVSNKRQHLYKEHIDKWRRQASGLEKTSASNILMYLKDLRLEPILVWRIKSEFPECSRKACQHDGVSASLSRTC